VYSAKCGITIQHMSVHPSFCNVDVFGRILNSITWKIIAPIISLRSSLLISLAVTYSFTDMWNTSAAVQFGCKSSPSCTRLNQVSKWEKISAGMAALPFPPSSLHANAILVTDRCKHQRPVA